MRASMETEIVCDRLGRRRRAFVDAARELFISQGFEGTTLGDVVDRAGGSLSTIYKLFGNKEGLLDAVIFEKSRSGEALIREIGENERDPVEALCKLAQALTERFLDQGDIALVRVVLGYSIENQSFAHRFYEDTVKPTRLAMRTLFEKWQAEGHPLMEEPELLAEMFLGMIISDLHMQAISHGIAGTPTPEMIRHRTEVFLRGAGLA